MANYATYQLVQYMLYVAISRLLRRFFQIKIFFITLGVAIAPICVIKLSFITLSVAIPPLCLIIITFSDFITLSVATKPS